MQIRWVKAAPDGDIYQTGMIDAYSGKVKIGFINRSWDNKFYWEINCLRGTLYGSVKTEAAARAALSKRWNGFLKQLGYRRPARGARPQKFCY